jgi:hypothetical protein
LAPRVRRQPDRILGEAPVSDPQALPDMKEGNFNLSYGGYTCGTCGAYVPTGNSHACPGWSAFSPPTTVTLQQVDLRVASALERIADALERIAEQGDKPA